MILKLNREQLAKVFLQPISRISDECSLNFNANGISTLVSDSVATIMLYAKLATETGLTGDEEVTLNFKEIRKLMKILDCIAEDEFTLKVDSDATVITHKSSAVSFKLHLVMDSVIKKCEVSVDKISNLKFDTTFDLESENIKKILKGSVFTTDTDKVYFFTKDKTVFAELTDKALQNLDSITFSASESYTGADMTTPLPFNMEILRLINGVKYDKLTVKINNTYKVLLFEISTPEAMFKYIISGYTK